MFSYHSGEQALVFPNPATGRPSGIKIQTLVGLGWHVTAEGLRVALPRFDAPRIQVQGTSRELDSALRRGAHR